jgi:hypothetical protein
MKKVFSTDRQNCQQGQQLDIPTLEAPKEMGRPDAHRRFKNKSLVEPNAVYDDDFRCSIMTTLKNNGRR